MTCTETVTILKDFVLSGAAITGAVVAIRGLSTWRHQLTGQTDYELSRRILVRVFKYREAINGVRNPVMWANEMPLPPEDKAKRMSTDQIRFYGTSNAYQGRWDKVLSEKAMLNAELIEAEAIWGDELKEIFNGLFDLEHELYTRIRHYIVLIDPDSDSETKKVIQDKYDKSRDIMYLSMTDEPDDYQQDLVSAIEEVEKYLKPKLSHK